MPEASKRRAFKISDGVRTLVLNFGELGPADAAAVRKLAGVSLSHIMQENQFDADSLLILWWLAQVKNGAQFLEYKDVLKTYPTFDSMDAFELTAVEDDEQDEVDPLSPLASGAA